MALFGQALLLIFTLYNDTFNSINKNWLVLNDLFFCFGRTALPLFHLKHSVNVVANSWRNMEELARGTQEISIKINY